MPSARTRAATRWGPGPSQVGHPSSHTGWLQRSTEPKTRALAQSSRITNKRTSSGRTCYGPRLVKAHSTSDAARFAAVFTGLLLLASVPVALAADADPTARSQTAGLRARSGSLEARATPRDTRALLARGELGSARKASSADIEARRATLAQRAGLRPEAARQSPGRRCWRRRASSRNSSALSTSSRAGDPLAVLLGPSRSTKRWPGSTASAAPPARTTGSSSRHATARTRLAGLDARASRSRTLSWTVSPPPRRRRAARARRDRGARRGFIGEPAPAAGPERGDASPRSRPEARTAATRTTRPRGRSPTPAARARRDGGADRHSVAASAR